MKIIKFYCGYCKDKLARTRKDMRKHLKERHKRNELFGTKSRENTLGLRDDRVIRIAFENET